MPNFIPPARQCGGKEDRLDSTRTLSNGIGAVEVRNNAGDSGRSCKRQHRSVKGRKERNGPLSSLGLARVGILLLSRRLVMGSGPVARRPTADCLRAKTGPNRIAR